MRKPVKNLNENYEKLMNGESRSNSDIYGYGRVVERCMSRVTWKEEAVKAVGNPKCGESIRH